MSKKNTNIKYMIAVAAAVAACLIIIFVVFGSAGSDETEESVKAIKNAITERALQCYAIEGVFPDSLSYLEEHYGLQINHEDYYIVYSPVAQNYPPQVTVAAKQQAGTQGIK